MKWRVVSARCWGAKLQACGAVERNVTKPTIKPLELSFGSELPTQPAFERSALAARLAARALKKPDEEQVWCDSEAPTGVEAERPLFPPSPRPPRI